MVLRYGGEVGEGLEDLQTTDFWDATIERLVDVRARAVKLGAVCCALVEWIDRQVADSGAKHGRRRAIAETVEVDRGEPVMLLGGVAGAVGLRVYAGVAATWTDKERAEFERGDGEVDGTDGVSARR